jgi:methylated-DNA-[protein]-cysteine S-methyltransferase
MPAYHHHLLETELGWVGIAWSANGLAAVQLPERDRAASERRLFARLGHAAAEEPALDGEMAILADRIRRHALGEAVNYKGVAIDLDGVDPFRADIYAAALELAFGETTTYGELALRAGHPGKARETGEALGRNPVPLVVPCHRILAAGGKIGGFSAPGGPATKIRLLALEGVRLGAPEPAQSAFAF